MKPPKPHRRQITASVRLPLASASAFDSVMDWQDQAAWILFTWVVAGQQSSNVGDVIVARSGFGRLGFTDTMQITEWLPGTRCVVRHTGKFVRGIGVFELFTTENGCVFVWSEIPEQQPSWYLMLWYVGYPINWLFLRISVWRLKRRLASVT